MITDDLTNKCNGFQKSQLEDKVDRLEKVVEGYDALFNTKELNAENIQATNGNIANFTAAGIVTDNIQSGAAKADSLEITGGLKAKSFEVTDPVLFNGLTSTDGHFDTLDANNLDSINANIDTLTVNKIINNNENSLEYKNLSVTNNATIGTLTLRDPHLTEVLTEHTTAINLGVQNIQISPAGKMVRVDTDENVISFVDGTTILGSQKNNIAIAGANRPTWNDMTLATLADIQSGMIAPVYKGVLETYSELPTLGNNRGDLYVIKQLVVNGQMGIGHAQWNGIGWDSYLVYELQYFTNTLYDQEIDGKKKFLQPIDGQIDNAVHHTAASIPEDGDLNTYVKVEDFGKVFYGNATDTTKNLPKDVKVLGNYTLVVRKDADNVALQIINFTDADSVVTESRTIGIDGVVLADWTRLVNTKELTQLETDTLNAIQDVIDGVTPVTKVAEGCVDTKGNKLATIKDVKTASWVGTKARFDAEKEITDVDNKDYIATGTLINLTDDVNDSLNVSSEVTIGDKNPVTSDAVAKIIEEVKASLSASMPIGSVTSFAGETAPSGYLICDGTELRDIDYPELSALIKGKYGAAASSDYFKLPNLKGRYVLGYDDTNALEPLGKSIEEQLPNIKGEWAAYYMPPYPNMKGCFGKGYHNDVGGNYGLDNSYSVTFNANKTLNPADGKTIDNPAYKDPVNGVPVKVRPNSVVMNYIIKAK